jgi:TetR/AcrR family transcriptional repressor of nem operon
MLSSHDRMRQHILDAGNQIIAAKGFSCVGLNEILQAAAVPKGSFYHYFKSKEQYGKSLIDSYFATYLDRLDRLFRAEEPSSRERLLRYWQQWLDTQCNSESSEKCLVVKLSGEVSDLSESMRLALRDGTDQVIARIAGCIEAGTQDGSLPALAPQSTAVMLYQLWLGASLLAKLHQDRRPLEQAMTVTHRVLASSKQ